MRTGLIEERTLPNTDPATIRRLVMEAAERTEEFGMAAPKTFPENVDTIRVGCGSLRLVGFGGKKHRITLVAIYGGHKQDAAYALRRPGRITLVAIRGGHRVVLEWEKDEKETRSVTKYFWCNLSRVAVPGGVRFAPLGARLMVAAVLSFILAFFSLIYLAANSADWRAAEYAIGGLYWVPIASLSVISAFGVFGGILILRRIWSHAVFGISMFLFLACACPLAYYHISQSAYFVWIWEPVALSYVKTALAVVIVVCTVVSESDFEY